MGDRRHTCTRSQPPSSQVVLKDDDLLTLILLRVPRKTLISSKCVSRQWHSLITTPHFHSLLPPLRVSGLFFQDDDIDDKVYFVHLDDPNTPSPFKSQVFDDRRHIEIVQSCNGLLLCYTAPVRCHNDNYYIVYNPSTNQVDTIPKHPGYNICMNLIFDPSKSLHYKAIAFHYRRLCESRVGDFSIYSSETGTWRLCIQSYLPSPRMWFRDGLYWNGCVHWLSKNPYLGSAVSDSLYFNVAEEKLVTFPSPPVSGQSAGITYFGESEDHLHYSEVIPSDNSLSVYEMKSDYSEWFVKYQIDLDPISKVFPEMKHRYDTVYNAAVVSVIRRENFKEDSFLVMELPGKIIRYNLVDRSFKLIWDFVEDLQDEIICGNLKAWPYIEWPNH